MNTADKSSLTAADHPHAKFSFHLLILPLIEGCVKGDLARLDIDRFHIFARFFVAMEAIHSAIFPFERKRPDVTDNIERANNLLEIDIAAADRTKIPAASGVAKIQMRSQDSAPAIELMCDIFHVHVIDPVRKRADKFDRIDELPDEVARIEVEAKSVAVIDRFESFFSGVDVVGDLSWVNFERKTNVLLIELIENWIP